MGYNIEYNPDEKFRYPTKVNKGRGRLVKATLLATVLFVTGFVVVKTGAYEWLIPGDPDVTVPAFSEMITDFSSGVSVKEAVINFCREIIAGVS